MIKRRTKGLKVGDTIYSYDGLWFPFESIEAYLEYDPNATSVLKGKIKCFEAEGISDHDEAHFDRIEDYQGRRPHFIVDSVELVKVEDELKIG